jgi:hypothetical protein
VTFVRRFSLEADLKTLKEFEPQTRAEVEALESAEFHREDELILDSLQDLGKEREDV